MAGPVLTDAQRRLFDRLVAGSAPAETIPRHHGRSRYPLSFAQQRIWIVEQMRPGTSFYNSHVALRLRGPLDVPRLEGALRAIVGRHEALRSVFQSDGEVLTQVVAADVPVDLPLIECEEADAEELLTEALTLPFDLERAPLFRAALVRTAPDDHRLVAVVHQGFFDGWSGEVFVDELARTYSGLEAAEPPIQVGDFSVWQRERLNPERMEPHAAYWRERLAGASPMVTFPPDRPRPAVQANAGAIHRTRIDAATTAKLRTFVEGGVTLFMTLLAGFGALLGRYAGTKDVVVGFPVAGRLRPETERLIGLFMNTLPIRIDLGGSPGFRELVDRVRRSAVEAYAHQELPFELLIDMLKPERSTTHNPFCQVLFQLRSYPRSEGAMRGLAMERLRLDSATSKTDLTVELRDDGDALDCLFEYDTDLYDRPTIERIGRHYAALLRAATAAPEVPFTRLPLLDDEERRRIVVDWNRTAGDHRADSRVDALFAEVAARQPDAVAVADGERRTTYRELDAAARSLAEEIGRLGVGPRSAVAFALDRSLEAVVTMLGILKAGCCYVPLDPSWPEERVRWIVENCCVRAIVDGAGCRAVGPSSGRTVEAVTPDDTAYVMYTSGSTGEPKGIAVPHRAVTRLVVHTDYVRLGPDDVLALSSSLAFDACTFELWGALLNGASVAVVRREELLDPAKLRAAIERHGITTMFVTTSLFRQLVTDDSSTFRRLRHLLFGGEAADTESVRAVLETAGPEVIHVYGPTEATTFAFAHRVTSDDVRRGVIPIGRPIANTTAYVLDEEGGVQPPGVAGELHLGGPGVASGYVGRPDLTAERFLDSPFVPGERLYRTGDLVRYRADGIVEFIGRNDDQVKLRGFRIEPAEVEIALRRHPAVVHAVVLVRKVGGEPRLVAYVTSVEPRPAAADLRRFLAGTLPEFMVPASFVLLDAMPLNSSGKIDRSALPLPGETLPQEGRQLPRDETETMLAALMGANLGDAIGIDDDFFERGGSSLGAVILLTEIWKKSGRRIPVEVFFRQPTVRGLADFLREEKAASLLSSVVTLHSAGRRAPVFLFPGGDGMEQRLLAFGRLAREIGDRTVHALAYRMELHRDCATLEQLATRYVEQIEASHPDGPYLLSGYCYGGAMAFEVARQLRARGREVGMLVLTETHRPAAGGGSRGRGLGKRAVRAVSRVAYHFRQALAQPAGQRFRYLVQRFARTGELVPALAGTRARLNDTPFKRLVRKYRPGRYDGELVMVLTERPFFASSMLAWGELAARFRVERIPGDHSSILRDDVPQLAAILRSAADATGR